MRSPTPFRRADFACSPIFWARTVQLALLCVVTFVTLGAGQSRFNRLGHELMCSCGCKQVLLECNHVGCPDSARMIGELKTQMAAGGNDTAVLNWFVAKYGATILAAPIRGGFDNVAWTFPSQSFSWPRWAPSGLCGRGSGGRCRWPARRQKPAATFPRPANPIHRTRHRMQHCVNASAARRSTEWDSSPPLPH